MRDKRLRDVAGSSDSAVDRWAFAAQAVSIGGAVLVLPVLLRTLDAATMGLWYVFATIGLLAQLVDGALEPTIARHVATSAADEAPDAAPGSLLRPGLRDVLRASSRIYRRAAALLAVILFGPALAFVVHVASGSRVALSDAVEGWCAFAAALVISSAFGYFNPSLQGGGRLEVFYRLVCVQRGVGTLLTLVAVLVKPGIPALGTAALAAALVGRGLAGALFRRRFGRLDVAAGEERRSEVAGRLVKDGLRLGGAQAGAFLIIRANVLLASELFGLAAAGTYALTMQAFDLIVALSTTPFQARLPRLYRHRSLGEAAAFKALAGRSLLIAWGGFVSLSVLLVAFGPTLLVLLRSRTVLFPRPALAAVAVILVLEMTHSIFATLITATGEIPFTEAALVSGVAVPLLGALLASVTGFGIYALLAAQAIVQACYNNWKWPSVMLRTYGTSLAELVRLALRREGPA